ncbi:MAG TPA: hypothetical protein VGC18_10670 [Lacisediminihabitans sp.]|uniref:hypothetical protein n=1 Tax=Lacisediminihabitans sp. TaxID=2787631 RepID=UPI002EDA380E
MTDATTTPDDEAGENALHLDADKTRDDLEETLDEIERRLTPAELWKSTRILYAERPLVVLGAAAGAVAAVGGLVFWAVASVRGASHRNG